MKMSETNEEKEQVKKIAKLRENIEQKIQSLKAELEEQKTLLNLIDSMLVKQSFKRAEIQKPPQAPAQKQAEPKTVTPQQPKPKSQTRGIPLKTITGDVLAELVSEKETLHIYFPQDKNFDINTPPFMSFFLDRVLAKMQEKDKEDAKVGKLDPDKIVSFEIKQDENTLKEMTIKNLRPDRSRELKSSLRWTLEKMFERMKQNS
jgi:hypothetical protein